jgi:hypothetical protein
MKINPLVALFVILFSTGILLAACSGSHADAPDPGNNVGGALPGTHAHVIQEPDGFRNVSFSCYGQNGIYVTSHGITSTVVPSSVFVLVNDPNCK